MEAFSDGVFSIAATLLVLEISLHPPGTALEQVLDEWPAYLGYLISFLTIGAAWLGHDAITDRMTRADSLLLRINLLLLLVVAFLPFPTKLIAEGLHDTDDERVFVTLYGLTLLTIRLLLVALDAYAGREHLYADGEADDELLTERRGLWPVLAGYVIAILIGLAAPTVAVVLYLALALALFLVVPFRDIRRLLLGRPYLPIRAGVVYAIRARTRAQIERTQIERTQIVRPRPHRTRGGPVEGARGTGGDLHLTAGR
jgi:uncharacterized membrane protein